MFPSNQLTIRKLNSRLSAVRITALKHALNPGLYIETRFPLFIVLGLPRFSTSSSSPRHSAMLITPQCRLVFTYLVRTLRDPSRTLLAAMLCRHRCKVMPPPGGGNAAKLPRHPFQTNSASQRRLNSQFLKTPIHRGYHAVGLKAMYGVESLREEHQHNPRSMLRNVVFCASGSPRLRLSQLSSARSRRTQRKTSSERYDPLSLRRNSALTNNSSDD